MIGYLINGGHAGSPSLSSSSSSFTGCCTSPAFCFKTAKALANGQRSDVTRTFAFFRSASICALHCGSDSGSSTMLRTSRLCPNTNRNASISGSASCQNFFSDNVRRSRALRSRSSKILVIANYKGLRANLTKMVHMNKGHALIATYGKVLWVRLLVPQFFRCNMLVVLFQFLGYPCDAVHGIVVHLLIHACCC